MVRRFCTMPFDMPGIALHEEVPVITLAEYADDHGIDVYLYFDPELAYSSCIEDDLRDFAMLPWEARPFMDVTRCIRLLSARDPGTGDAIRSGKVYARVLDMGRMGETCGCVPTSRQYIRALLLGGSTGTEDRASSAENEGSHER